MLGGLRAGIDDMLHLTYNKNKYIRQEFNYAHQAHFKNRRAIDYSC